MSLKSFLINLFKPSPAKRMQKHLTKIEVASRNGAPPTPEQESMIRQHCLMRYKQDPKAVHQFLEEMENPKAAKWPYPQ